MNQSILLEKITELKYAGMKEAYLRQVEDVSYHAMSFDDRLYQLLDAQDIFLRDKCINSNRRLSKIKDKQAKLELVRVI